MQTFMVLRQPFTVDAKYEYIRDLGVGAYGTVWCVHKPTTPPSLMVASLVSPLFVHS